MADPLISIVIPALDEAQGIAAMLDALAPMRDAGAEIIVVDGGSADATVEQARGRADQVLQGPRGRARQMNHGAAAARGDILLFVHADTRLPDGALALVGQALRTHAWGRFDVTISGRPALLRVIAAMMNWRSRATGIATGDQAIFVTRAAFGAVGGFPDQPLMEDIELSKRLRRIGAPACLPERVVTSGRRWETHGPLRTMWLMWRLRFLYWLGTPAEKLAKAYR
jgi:rSAM/selenodomain-associated transferase 2